MKPGFLLDHQKSSSNKTQRKSANRTPRGVNDELGPLQDRRSVGSSLYHQAAWKAAAQQRENRNDLVGRTQRGMFPTGTNNNNQELGWGWPHADQKNPTQSNNNVPKTNVMTQPTVARATAPKEVTTTTTAMEWEEDVRTAKKAPPSQGYFGATPKPPPPTPTVTVTAPSTTASTTSTLTGTHHVQAIVTTNSSTRGHNNDTNMTTNPIANVPTLPFKTGGVPKAALYTWYARAPLRKPILPTDYYAFHDGGPPHLIKWTAVFLCPLTGEVFASGRHGDSDTYHVDSETGIVWYTKKTLAWHGAAARAYDCLTRRQAPPEQKVAQIGLDEPYAKPVNLTITSLPLYKRMPPALQQEIQEAQQRIFRLNKMDVDEDDKQKQDDDMNQDGDDEEEEAAWSQPDSSYGQWPTSNQP